MNASAIQERLPFLKNFTRLIFIFFIVYGFITKFFISLYLSLDSDSVGMGLMSMEIGKHYNFLLSGYHLLSTDSLVLTELIPFQLVPQILTNYNPVALKLVVFFIFILAVFLLSYLVYLVTKDTTATLLFGALAANIPPEGYFWYTYPTTHNATIVFGALILILLCVMNTRMRTHKKGEGAHREMNSSNLNISWSHFIALLVLVFLSVFSDSIILVWILIPCIIAHILVYPAKGYAGNFIILLMGVVAVIAYVIKTFFIPGWIKGNFGIHSISDIFLVNIPLYLKAQAMLLNTGLYHLMGGREINIVDILSILLFAVLILYTLLNMVKDFKKGSTGKRFFYTIFVTSIVLIVVSFLISTYVYDITGARYLTFGTLAILILVAASSSEGGKSFTVIVVAFLILSGISSFAYVSNLDPNPNEREYDLISFLEDQNLMYGYGTYWDSNIITYLSKEKVTIRPTYFLPDSIRPFLLNACDRWWEYRPESAFLLVDTTRNDEYQAELPSLREKWNLSKVFHYRDYDIYPITLK
ncbi:hypothetical protein J2741_002082 [Methanolinea mesophila]|uniref:hypothetical protein n=1 Tax=Methanolinea mesophila TaxID=547055 RepID=UPI001AE6E711|nr:hypothetical protein [Methanolinea mesophila]MBP1929535.1 hypothetical protein [Methanolinea mesophila]